MYSTSFDKVHDVEEMKLLMEQFPFAQLVDGSLNASSVPVIWQNDGSRYGRLVGHLAAGNTLLETAHEQRCLAIFQSPDHYISPDWYEKGPAVPTWNYASVHAWGVFKTLNHQQTAQILKQQMQFFEPTLVSSSKMADDQVQQSLLSAIVGFSLTIDHLEAKKKLGQHRSDADQKGVYQHLSQSSSANAQAMAQFLARNGMDKS
ncbi:FMN-binding negative transcriptional regulator [Celerinatantimonas diazotrophica]|uniref:PaiB family negative transcriptional regulator n=1 Tax=Celerinatantimonas diazotrophica TaxID=412034 RepID=A0A4R1JA46_9GAMM|nr:FMN-binding negative transcriptional regulator [Celerinatantimonas diazotrophica]TCK47478.1 PaiB family negative transcriptional regulator [Celerinatantimonas diazotrophica]CAG9296904.1 Protease synthase and sporulation protein PAI 2 [Celerinatantimonas diazotrophica]